MFRSYDIPIYAINGVPPNLANNKVGLKFCTKFMIILYYEYISFNKIKLVKFQQRKKTAALIFDFKRTQHLHIMLFVLQVCNIANHLNSVSLKITVNRPIMKLE